MDYIYTGTYTRYYNIYNNLNIIITYKNANNSLIKSVTYTYLETNSIYEEDMGHGMDVSDWNYLYTSTSYNNFNLEVAPVAPTGYNTNNWNTLSNGTGTTYDFNSLYNANGSTTGFDLYLQTTKITLLNKSTNIKFSDIRNDFFVNKTFTPIKYSYFYPTSNFNTVDIPNIPIFPVANSSMKLSYFKNIGKTLFNITVSGTEANTKTIPHPELVYNSGNSSNYYLKLLHQGTTNTNNATTPNYTEYNIRFPFTVNAEVLLVGGGGGGGAGFNNYNYGAGGNSGGLIYTSSYTFRENITYKIRIGAGGLGMQSSTDTTTIDGTSSIIYENEIPLLTALGGKIGRYIYSNNYFTLFGSLTANYTVKLLKKAFIQYNYTSAILSILPETYIVSFENGAIIFGSLSSHKTSYPILKDTNNNILNPIIWYKFDSSNTSMMINAGSYGTSYNATEHNLTYDTVNYIRGSGSGSFNTSFQQYFTLPVTLNFNQINTTNGISFSLWFKMTSSSPALSPVFEFGTKVVANTSLGSRCIKLFRNNSNSFDISIVTTTDNDGTNSILTYNASLNTVPVDNLWKHFVWTISKTGTWNIYVNNVKIYTSDKAVIPPFTVSNTYKKYNLGKSLFSARSYFDGNIDDFRIYDFILSSTQVQELYNGRLDIYYYNPYTTDSYANEILLSQKMNTSISYDSRLFSFNNVNGNNGTTTPIIFNYTSSIQTLTIPTYVKYINIYCWGAGGGGSAALNYNPSPGGYGGDGGFVMGTLDVSTIRTLKIIVGQGGRKGIQAQRCGYAFGGGGDAGSVGDGNWAAGGGGGLSGVFIDDANITISNNIINSAATPVIIAGGGGASALNNSKNGGNAGGLIGNDGEYIVYIGSGGYGGTQSAGGNGTSPGTKFNGGSCSVYGGGGGGGYYGGGASTVTAGIYIAAGGGGSSYINTTDFIFTNTSIPNAQPNGSRIVNGNTNKYYNNNAGLGADIGLNNGNDGLIVIEWLTTTNEMYGSGGGGGGANSAGGTPIDIMGGTGGNGGNAKLITITGKNEYYAAGGGGSAYNTGTGGTGGIGDTGVYLGGNGTNNSSIIKISNAVDNTGSGGGGSACDGTNPSIGGNGSAGICIIKYFPYIFYPPLSPVPLILTKSLISTNKYIVTINTLNYIVKFSSSLSSANDPYVLLDRNTTTNWNTGSSTYTNLGTYTGEAYLVNNYTGEWVYYKLPYSIMLKEYKISGFLTRFPLLWKIYGSNNETNWTEIEELSNNTTDAVYTNSIFAKTLQKYIMPYKYIGIVIKKASNVMSNSFVFDGFELSGLIYNLTNLNLLN